MLEEDTFSIVLAENERHFDAVRDVFRRVYIDELCWIPAHGYDCVVDRYAPFACYLLASCGDTPVGMIRMVCDSYVGLPVEQFARAPFYRGGRILECQRLMVVKDFRPIRSSVVPFGFSCALLKAALHFCLLTSTTYVLADVFVETETTPTESLLNLGFRRTNIFFRDTELKESSDSTLLELAVRDLLRLTLSGRTSFHKYMTEADDHFDFYSSRLPEPSERT